MPAVSSSTVIVPVSEPAAVSVYALRVRAKAPNAVVIRFAPEMELTGAHVWSQGKPREFIRALGASSASVTTTIPTILFTISPRIENAKVSE